MAAVVLVTGTSCYHYAFEQRRPDPESRLVTHVERRPTYLNGFVGTGTVETVQFCDAPVRTELRVTAIDVLLSLATLLVYTPHTLTVTCEVPDRAQAPGVRKW